MPTSTASQTPPQRSVPLRLAPAVAGNGGRLGFVVAYSIPAGAASAAPYSSGTVTATAVTTALYAVGNTSVADVDQVNVTTAAAFSATKSLSIPSVTGPSGTGPYPAATQTGQRSTSGSCLATYAGASAPAAGCVYSTYTINFQNSGGAAGAFYMNDILPAGFTYVTGSAVWSGASGVALTEATGEPTAGIDFQQSAQVVSAKIANVNPSVAGSISFMVLVNNTATVGVGSTSNTATYDAVTTVKATAMLGAGSASTNAAAFTVTATYGVTLGSSTGAVGGSTDTTPGTPNGTFGTAGVDQNLIAGITTGGSIKFTQKVFNTGNAADTFNMTVSSNTFPAGSSFAFYQADGVTPLLDTNSDGTVDTGTIASAGSTTIVVQATIPGSVVPPAGPFKLTALATSAGNALLFDATGDQVTAVTGALVDLTHTAGGTGSGSVGSGDLGAGPSPSPTTTKTTPAGTGTIFNLFIKNGDSGPLDFNLAASQTPSFPGSLPAGWTVKFVAVGGTCTGTAITTTGSIAAGSQLAVDACVTPSTTAIAGTTNVYFRATSTTAASTTVVISDTVTDAVTVTAAATYSSTLTPNNSGQVSPSGTVVFAHTINNTGAQSCGAYTLSTTQTGAGWTVALFLDVNNNGTIDGGDTPITGSIAGPMVAGGSQKILARVFAPGGAAVGTQDTLTVTVTFTDVAPNCGTHSATDVSTVVASQIRVVKNQSIDANCDGIADGAFAATIITGAKPGQCVVYQVTATNEGVAAIANLAINDALPNFTTLSIPANQPAAQCVASAGGITGTAPAYVASGATVSCGSTANSVNPGATLQLNFAVKINP